VICNKISFLYPVCKDCRTKHFSVETKLSIPRCKICGRELISSKNYCSECKETPLLKSTDMVFPVFSYRLWNKELLFRWKINGERNLSQFYASIVNKVLNHFEIKKIVPVPPRKGKIKENGWDQIDELCKILQFKYKYSLFKLLERESVIQQKKLNREERLETIKNAYSLADYKGELPEKVCLIDDVCTTGSTIECCASLLKSAGVKKVFVVTLYIVD